jgi:hypothetical protein
MNFGFTRAHDILFMYAEPNSFPLRYKEMNIYSRVTLLPKLTVI